MSITPAFASGGIDRADHVRNDADQLRNVIMNPSSRLLLMDGLDPIISAEGTLSYGSLMEADAEADLLFLGFKDDHALFASLVKLTLAPMFNPHLWRALSALSGQEAALYAAARSVVDWHNRHQFCAVCGTRTRSQKGGWARKCSPDHGGCGAEHFPRVDPVTIMLVHYQGKLLLGRQPQFPPKNYSALAGFVEPGESIEGAVARETLEEVGIKTENVRYMCSQPWPFPSSLMIGCIADALDDKIMLDEQELEDVIWVSRDEVKAALAGDADAPFAAPPPLAIARTLLEIWLSEQEG